MDGARIEGEVGRGTDDRRLDVGERHRRGLRGDDRARARRIVQDQTITHDPAKIQAHQHEDGGDRQDQRELDDGLRPLADHRTARSTGHKACLKCALTGLQRPILLGNRAVLAYLTARHLAA